MALDYGTAANLTVQLAGPFSMGGGAAVKLTVITLPAAGWKGAASPYSQEVAVDGVSVSSMVDLQPDGALLELLRQQELTLYTENNEGIVTVFAVGDRPAQDITVQSSIVEVSV